MQFQEALRSGSRVLRYRATDVWPVYLGATGVGIAVQSVGVLAVVLAYLSLRGTGRIETVVAEAEDVDFGALAAGEASSGTTGEFREFLEVAAAELLTPTVLLVAAVGGALAVTVAVLARALAAAAKVNAARAALTGEDPVEAGVRGARADVGRFARFVLLQGLLFLAPPLLAAALAVFGGAPGILLGLVVLLAWIPLVVFGYVGLLFVREAMVVEDVGLLRAIGHNGRFFLDHPARAVLFVVLNVAGLLLSGVLANVLTLLGASRVAGAFSLLLVIPWLELVKMAVYLDVERPVVSRGDDAGAVGPAATDSPGERAGPTRSDDDGTARDDLEGDGPTTAAGPTRSLLADVRAGLGRGVAEVRSFVPRHPGLVAIALACFAGGTAGGYAATAATGIDVTAGAQPGADFGIFPVNTALQLAANNWLVAVSQAYAGVLLGVPAAVNLLFNGLLVGGLAGLGFDPRVFLALVAPHGVIEIPALAVSGAAGLFLARRTWAFARGRRPAPAFAGDVRTAFRVLVGLLPAFVLAGFVEAFLTPLVGDLVLSAIGG